MKSARSWIVVGALLAALSVVLGAFAAHGLEGRLSSLYPQETRLIAGFEVPASFKYAQDFTTAARYQMYHALGLIVLGLVAGSEPRRSHWLAAWSFVIGITLFSGSLYLLVLTGQRWLGAITPIGGMAMIVGWVFFALAALAKPGAVESSSTANVCDLAVDQNNR